MLLRELAAQTPGQRVEWLKKLRTPPNGEVTALDRKILAYEQQYEMTTAEMKKKFKQGLVKDTADIARWLVLASARG